MITTANVGVGTMINPKQMQQPQLPYKRVKGANGEPIAKDEYPPRPSLQNNFYYNFNNNYHSTSEGNANAI